ncbi:MAG: MBOAT family protein [Oscillospiraceae bacterium]|nr:MBOAT family protein [Oscillospiraceae bacterium]
MSYTSLNFILFVCLVAVVYFLFPKKQHQWTVLLAASYVFYLIASYRLALFLLLTTVTTYSAAIRIEDIALAGKAELKEHKKDWDKETKKAYKEQLKSGKKKVMLAALILNLGILAFLKYYNFFAGSLNDLLGAWKLSFSVPTLRLLLPLGISFYTFQSVGYVVDVYWDKTPAERNLGKFALFVSFFPQIVQGPISFYDQLAHQLYEPHSFDFTRCKHGLELILWGFFKKLVIADRAVIAINAVVADYAGFGGTTLTFTVLLYALQLYTDFSGGIDISRGVAQILGIDMVKNFNRPYFATSINDYWRRWHITLGAWMKEYVFYPLALSKKFIEVSKKLKATKFGQTEFGAHVSKVLPTSFASLVVFFLVGVWHGANWKYVAFGLWNGGIIMLSTLLEPKFDELTEKLKLNAKSLGFRVFQMLRTFLVVLVGYVFDVAPDLTQSMHTFALALTDQNLSVGAAEIASLGLGKLDYLLLMVCTGFLFVISVIQERNSHTTIRQMLDEQHFAVRYIFLLTGILALLVFGIYGPGFDPTAFVYMQF